MRVDAANYELVGNKDGIIAVIIHGNRLLLLKRPNLPLLIASPGIWGFVMGGRKKGEKYIDVAYREIHEETKLKKEDLELLAQKNKVLLFDPVYPGKKWYNSFFIFRSNTAEVKLDFENKAYRWAPFRDILGERRYSNVFLDKKPVLRLISGSLE